ncbi:hypothetical protein [Paraprevotella clara]|jgi:hypothetical protein|uniref:hypothetical protein n=1 Tax=Paraprevotella clara TaxID=454154 RepID=UPI004028DB35
MNGIQLDGFEPSVKVRHGPDGKITEGLQVGDTLRQNQALILVLHKGELKERPSTGCGIEDMLLDNDPMYWRSLIREQMEMDGQTVSKVAVTKTGITIEATY